MGTRRLTKEEFETVANLINKSTNGDSVQELEERRDFLLDIADMVTEEKDRALFNLWARNIQNEINVKLGMNHRK